MVVHQLHNNHQILHVYETNKFVEQTMMIMYEQRYYRHSIPSNPHGNLQECTTMFVYF